MQAKSLQRFFDDVEPVTLNNCDLEAIHRSGAIQGVGILFAFDPISRHITHWSENAVDRGFLPHDSGQGSGQDSGSDANAGFAGRTIAEVLPEVADEVIALADDEANRHQHIALSDLVSRPGPDDAVADYDAIVCCTEDIAFVELLPSVDITPRELRAKLRGAQRATGAIMSARTFADAEQLATDAIRELTGYGRVKVYKFLPDGSGEVTAESRDEALPSYRGLHFPATDIPKQARHLYAILPFRPTLTVVNDISPIVSNQGKVADSLDMTWCLTRSVSTMHTAYLRNMGVGSAYSCSLMDHGMLWGLISCHSLDRSPVSFDVWGLVRDIAEALMAKLNQCREAETTAKIKEMRDLEASVAVQLREKGQIEDVLADYAPTLQRFLDAEGFAFQFDGKIYSVGNTPPLPFIRRLIKWVGERDSTDDYFRSKALHRDWPAAKDHMETACGVLVQPVIIHRVCQLVWFRSPITTTVRWAGDPNAKKVVPRADGTHVLQPRNSFDQWVEEHREESREWSDAEINAAREIFKDVLDIIATQAQNLRRMTQELTLSQEETREELAQFAYAAAHDIQNPINTITSALDLLRTVEESSSDPVVKKSLDYAMRSSDRLRNLADQMANFVALGRREIEPEPVALDDVVADALQMLDHAVSEHGATFDCNPLPTVAGSRDLLTILFLNIFSNAMKYRAPDRSPKVKVRSTDQGRYVHLSIEDNGIGIMPEFAARIFQPFDRLHRADDIPGSGLGLATCKRIAELHKTSILLDPDFTDGARFTIDFRKSAWGQTTFE
ncbi:MAG: ATP-binding protein [Hyphomicrobiales bacterium]